METNTVSRRRRASVRQSLQDLGLQRKAAIRETCSEYGAREPSLGSKQAEWKLKEAEGG